jgi:hypothetical protein
VRDLAPHAWTAATLVERAARGQPVCESMKAAPERDLHAISQKCDEDMGFDPLFVLMENRTDRQVAFEPSRLEPSRL